MTDGLYGLNTRTIGVSRDMIIAAQARIDGAFLLTMDDPQLAAAASAQGALVIYRQSGDGQGGSNPLAEDPMVFLRERAKNAPNATYLHATNELDPSDDLHRWTKELLGAARSLKRKVVIYNHSTHKSAAQWQSCAANVAQAVADGCAVGWHAYPDTEHDGTAFEFLALKHRVGGLWIGTEFAYTRSYTDSARGWRGVTSPEQRRAFLAKWIPFLSAEQMPVCIFSFDSWDKPTVEAAKAEGFGFWDYPDVLDAMADLNHSYPFKGVPMPTYPPLPAADDPRWQVAIITRSAGVNVRSEPVVLNGNVVGVLTLNHLIRVLPEASSFYPDNAYVWQPVKLDSGVVGWARNDVFDYRLVDPPVESPEVEAALEQLSAAKFILSDLSVRIDHAIASLKGETLPDSPGDSF